MASPSLAAAPRSAMYPIAFAVSVGSTPAASNSGAAGPFRHRPACRRYISGKSRSSVGSFVTRSSSMYV